MKEYIEFIDSNGNICFIRRSAILAVGESDCKTFDDELCCEIFCYGGTATVVGDIHEILSKINEVENVRS